VFNNLSGVAQVRGQLEQAQQRILCGIHRRRVISTGRQNTARRL
jgi:hypothetical protein